MIDQLNLLIAEMRGINPNIHPIRAATVDRWVLTLSHILTEAQALQQQARTQTLQSEEAGREEKSKLIVRRS